MPDLRHDDAGAIDEVVARGADVHLEMLSDHECMLIITESDGTETYLVVRSKTGRAAIEVVCTETTGAGPERAGNNGWVER